MLNLNKLDELEYLVNGAGEKIAVVLPVQDFRKLIEDIEDLAAVAERRVEATISHDRLITELRRDGLLQD